MKRKMKKMYPNDYFTKYLDCKELADKFLNILSVGY